MPVRLTPEAAKAWGLALSFGWRIVAGVLLGFWLDNRFETTPIFISVLSIGALVGAIADMLRVSKAASQDSENDEEP